MRFTIGLRWRAVKGGVEKNPVFLLKAGFFISKAMKKLISNVMENWRMSVSASISIGFHLLLIFSVVFIFSGAQIRQTSIRHVKVTLYSWEDQKKSISQFVAPLSVKNQIKKPEKKESTQEEKKREPVLKKEVDLPVPLPVQVALRDVPPEEPKPLFPSRAEEKTVKEPVHITMDIALDKVSSLKKEEDLSTLSFPGESKGSNLSDAKGGEGAGIGQGGSPGGDAGNGLGTARGGFHWRVFREGTELGQGGSRGGGSGIGSGSGTNSGEGDSRGGGSRKGAGIFGRLFSSFGGVGGGSARYAENPKPPYPEEARKKGVEGEVLLRAEVLANGWVGQIEVKRSSGHEILDRSALSTVKQWRFIPANGGNGSIPCWVNIPIKFHLQ